MKVCIIFGGAGYIGTKLAEFFLATERFDKIYIADIKKSTLEGKIGIVNCVVDVRENITIPALVSPVDWIFNFAAIHREPGHASQEYYQTNILGAQNVCEFAEAIDCKNIVFTSSISVYGPTLKPTSEYTLTMPNTPYGISKLAAEYTHKIWVQKIFGRKLVIVRPGVIYGPGDPGNILRMINAIKKGYFFLPVSPNIRKSYGYIYGLIDSIEFMMLQPDKAITYNYVEQNTEMLGQMITLVNTTLGFNGKIIRVPFKLLQGAAFLLHKLYPNLNGIHPERVKKVARPTHIIPKVLSDREFIFNYDFKKSLVHWKKMSPQDF